MAKYRIVQIDDIFVIEKKILWFWDFMEVDNYINCYHSHDTLEDAIHRLKTLTKKEKYKVIKEYD